MDALSALLDEVALEGLDGITLPSLWLRLDSRRPRFPQKIDHFTKGFLWRALIHNPEISFYEQPQERQDVELYDRFQNVDPDTGIEHLGPTFDNRRDVYPAGFVTDHPDGIQGSCGFFRTRTDVGAQIRSDSSTALLSLEQAWERFGRRLVLVASQKARFRVLIGTHGDPDLRLTDESYCLLERVGRSRWDGELQRDLSNSSFKIEPRKIHYLRKALVQHSLVSVQSHVSRLDSGTQQHSCLLLLRRFHSSRRSKYDLLMERVSNILEASPGQHCTQMALRQHLHLNEGPFQRIFRYMRSAKLVELFMRPLEELDPESGPCVTKKGTKVQVSCIKLLKPYSRKKIPDDKEEEEEEGADFTPVGRILERDLLSQAYGMVVSSGTSGLTCAAMGVQMHVGKQERRMLCRQLEREGVVKGFMEDVGRQRTTKFLSHKCVEVSDSLQQFVREQERNQLLCSGDSPTAPSSSSSSTKTLSNLDMCRKPALFNTLHNLPAPRGGRKAKKGSKKSAEMQPTEPTTTEEEVPLPPPAPAPAEAAADTDHVNIVTDVQPPLPELFSHRHKTCRLLRRKNLIVEAIQDMKIFDGLYPFQKIIAAEEKNLGFSTKCCKKTVLRLVQALAREGLIRFYTTTVIQDGLTKKVDLYAHPSILPTDEIVQRTIDQVRFKMSGSHSNARPLENDKSGETSKGPEGAASTPLKEPKSHKKKPEPKVKAEKFAPTTVRGLSRTFGYQPKMHRVRVIHNFLWYLVYGHPLRHNLETQAFDKESRGVEKGPKEDESRGVERGPKGDEEKGPKGDEESRGVERGPKGDEEKGSKEDESRDVEKGPKEDESRGVEKGPKGDEESRGVEKGPKGDEEKGSKGDEEKGSKGDEEKGSKGDEEKGSKGDEEKGSKGDEEKGSKEDESRDVEKGPKGDEEKGFKGDEEKGSKEDESRDVEKGPKEDESRGVEKGPKGDEEKGPKGDEEKGSKEDESRDVEKGPKEDESRGVEKGPKGDKEKGPKGDEETRGVERGPKGDEEKGSKEDESRGLEKGPKGDEESRGVEKGPKGDEESRGVEKGPKGDEEKGSKGDEEKGSKEDEEKGSKEDESRGVEKGPKGDEEKGPKGDVEKGSKGDEEIGSKGDEEKGSKGDEEKGSKAAGAEEPEQGRSTTEKMLLSEDEEGTPPANFKVYSEGEPWKKYVPPVKLHTDYSSGWVMLGDLILCLPLSLYIQVIQVNYKVEGLEEYLNDPEKQHYLVRCLPPRMKRQLLYKRRYIFSFHDNLKKLAYMGLIQFGPLEKFRDKDQTFIYLKRHATIVDTTSAEPHYWLVTENPERPFGRRSYTFNTSDDVENFWFDLMCVCLNTPLGVIRTKKDGDATEPSFVRDSTVFVGMSYLIKGSSEIMDDGVIPGDGKGAGGLCSEFFAHLKRNWLWTNHLLADKQRRSGLEADDTKVRLKSLCRSSLQLVLQAERATLPSYLSSKKKMLTEVEVVEEPFIRNKQVVGGKQKKRKRIKKEVVKPPRKKKEPVRRSVAHDERDHEALKQMTRQRVYWSLQEDSLMMLCAAAAHLLNTKLKRPFVPYCVVRDVLHSEFDKSRDKTSLAVGRRTRYILKNPQTLLNYRICLAEVGQDKAFLKRLDGNLPKNPDDAAECAVAFAEYVRLLREKFSSTTDPRDLQIPDSKEQLFSGFKISAIDDGGRVSDSDALNRTEDIHAIVLHNLIQSTLAMTNSQMKSSRSFQTFHVYSCYSQELLCQVFVQCRKRGLVNRRRINHGIGPKKNRALPILPMSYQLSHSYYRCFSWRFPQVLCTDSFRFVRDLLSLPRGDHRPVTYFHQETENRAPDGELLERKLSVRECVGGASGAEGIVVSEPDVSDMMHFSLELPGGACAAALSLLSLGLLSVHLSIPKQMVVVDSTMVDSETVKSTLDDEEEDEDEPEETKKNEGRASKASHTKYLLMKGYCSPGIVKLRNLNTNDNIVVESCVIKVQLRERPVHAPFSLDLEPALDLRVCGPSLLPPGLSLCLPSAPPVSLEQCMSRLQQQQGYSAEDLQACTLLWHALEGAGERGLGLDEFPHRLEELKLAEPPRTRTLHQYTQDLQQQGEAVLVGAQSARWVLRRHAQPWLVTLHTAQWTKAMGDDDGLSTRKYLPPNTRKRRRVAPEESSTKRMALDTCAQKDGNAADDTRSEALGNTGEEDRSLQAEEKQRPTSPQPESSDPTGAEEEGGPGAARAEEDSAVPHEEEERQKTDSPTAGPGDSLSFVVRPWRMVDGKVNRVVCKGMLEALLHHVMSVPGAPQESLLQHYRSVLQPQVTLELLQALMDLGCVTRKTVTRRAKASLFSGSAPSALGTCVYYEPTVSCVLRLSQVLPHERHWNSGVP